MKKLVAVASFALALVTGSAFAADLPSLKAPVVLPPPAFSWTGLYGGVNIGYGLGNGDRDPGGSVYAPFLTTPGVGFCGPVGCPVPLIAVDPGGSPAWSIGNDLNGVLGGGQVGYNHQFNPWLVVGVEADIQATDVHSQGNGYGASSGFFGPHLAYATQNKSVDWFGTVRGRVGLTFPGIPNVLVYGTGGLAYGGVVHSFNVSDFFPAVPGVVVGAGSNYDGTRTGWTAGGGLEWCPAPAHPLFGAFSVKLEYLYTDLGATTLYGASIGAAPPGGPAFFYTHTSQTRWSTVRLGVNWHFNPFTPAAVLVATQ